MDILPSGLHAFNVCLSVLDYISIGRLFYCSLFDVEWVGGREENGCSPVFFLTALLLPTLSTNQKNIKNNTFIDTLLRFFLDFWALRKVGLSDGL